MTGGAGFSSQAESSMRNNRNALGKRGKNPLGKSKTDKAVEIAKKKMSLDEFSTFSENVRREASEQRKRQLIIFSIVVVVLAIFALIVISSIQ